MAHGPPPHDLAQPSVPALMCDPKILLCRHVPRLGTQAADRAVMVMACHAEPKPINHCQVTQLYGTLPCTGQKTSLAPAAGP